MPDLITAQQFLVVSAVREAFRHDDNTQSRVAREVQRLAPELGKDERLLLIRDIETELSYSPRENSSSIWLPVVMTIKTVTIGVNDGHGRHYPVLVDERIVLGAVRYALGRQTYIVSMTGEEVERIVGDLDEETGAEILGEVEKALAATTGPIMEWDDLAAWERVAHALRPAAAVEPDVPGPTAADFTPTSATRG